MTFSLVARCSQTGMLGVAIASSSICVVSRCPWVRSGVGASTTQNVTDPSLGNLMLNYLEEGLNVQETIDKIIEKNKFIDYRQLSLIDTKGNSASFTGSKILGKHAVSKGVDCIATGNLLRSTNVINSMTDNFTKNSNSHFIERLLLALLQDYFQSNLSLNQLMAMSFREQLLFQWNVLDLLHHLNRLLFEVLIEVVQ